MSWYRTAWATGISNFHAEKCYKSELRSHIPCMHGCHHHHHRSILAAHRLNSLQSALGPVTPLLWLKYKICHSPHSISNGHVSYNLACINVRLCNSLTINLSSWLMGTEDNVTTVYCTLSSTFPHVLLSNSLHLVLRNCLQSLPIGIHTCM